MLHLDQNGLSVMLAVERCHIRGESENLLRGSSEACEGSTLALKPCADVTRRLKQGYQGYQWINVLQNIFKKGSLVPRPGVRKLYGVLLSYYV